MPSLAGITEIIGVRAVIIDVRQYLADGREIERVNERIALASKKVETTSVAAATAQKVSFASQRALAAAQLKATLDQAKADDLAAKAKANAAKITAAGATGLVGPNGQPITNTALVAEQARLTKDLATANKEAATSTKIVNILAKENAAAVSAASIADARHSAVIERKAVLERQLADANRSRIRAAASGVALIGTAAIGGIAAASISSAAKYEQELSKINVLTSATDAQTAQLGKQFLELSTQIPVSASDLAAGAYKVLSSGIKDTGTALEITTNAAKAAAAGQGDIKDIISATIAVLNGYPKGAITAAQVNDILFAGVKEGNAEFNDFAGSIGKLIPVAAALGVPFDQLTASLAVLTNGGLNAEEAATGLRAILNDLAKDEGSKQAQEALKAVGLTVEDLRRSIVEKGLPQAIGDLITLFKGNLAAIEPIIPNIRGMVAAYGAFSDGGKTAVGVLNSIDNSAGIVNQAFEKTRNNTANLAKIFSNELNVAFIEIGQAVLPAVNEALKGLIKFLQDNRQEIRAFVSQGLQAIINLSIEAAKGIKVLTDILGALFKILQNIVGQSTATQLALAAIGAGLAFALPGGPVIVGLTTILLLLSQIQDLASGGKSSPVGRAIVQGTAIAAGALGGGLLGAATFTPFGVGAGAIGGAALGGIGGKALSDFLFGTSGQDNLNKTNELLNRINDDTHTLGNQTLPKLDVNIGGVNKSAQDAAKELKKLAEEFLKTSEAAGQVESLTVAFKKFGTISKELADAMGFSAAQAGQVQAVDAVVRAQERAKTEAFNYIEAINAVSGAWRRSAEVGRQLLLQLAQTALEASQTALSQVFSRPTREVADLGVPLARQQLNTAQTQQRNNPAIYALQQQLRSIDRQIAAQNKANQAAQKAAQQAQKQQQAAQKAAQQAQQAQLDALKLANLIAQIASERQLAALQKLIDANNKQAADLQEAFIKSNDDLQKQINQAIGKGDTATALGLVETQRKATKEYEANQKAIQKSTQNLTSQQKAAQEAEAERQRQAQLAEAMLQSQQKQIDATDSFTESLSSATDATDAQTEVLNNQKDAIQAQIDALQAPIEASQEQEKRIQESIAVYEAQTNVLKALGVAADKTLLTQAQQAQAAEYFTAQIAYASGQAQILAKSFFDFIPGTKDADTAFRTLKGAVEAVNLKIDPGLLGTFDAAIAYGELLKKAKEDITTTFNNASNAIQQQNETVQLAISNALTDITATWSGSDAKVTASSDHVSSKLESIPGKFERAISDIGNILRNSIRTTFDPSSLKGLLKSLIPHLAIGGIFTKPTLGIIGESGPEAVLPLNNVKRTNQILSQANVSTAIGTAGSFSPLGGQPYSGGLQNATGSGPGAGGTFSPLGGFSPSPNEILARASQRQIMTTMPGVVVAHFVMQRESSAIFAPNITVTGQTLDTMEAAAIAAVQKAFRDARVTSGRQGGLITQGLGPSR